MLHTLMRSPFEINMVLLMNMLKSFDDLLMLQDGVILALSGNIFFNKLLSVSSVLYALEEDVYARGIQKKISSKIKLVNYEFFVYLTEKNKQQMSW